MDDFIEEIKSVIQTSAYPSELMRIFQTHGAKRKALVRVAPSLGGRLLRKTRGSLSDPAMH
mgnify:CR=1 FL=1